MQSAVDGFSPGMYPPGPHSVTSSEVARRAKKERQEAEHFAVWDYDPGILGITSCAVCVGCAVAAVHMWTDVDKTWSSGGLHSICTSLLIVQGMVCSAMVVTLKTRGPHVRYVVRNYQQLTASFFALNFYLGLAQCAVREREQPRSFGGLSTCLVLGYTMALSAVRLQWEWVATLLAIDLVGAVMVGHLVGLSSPCLQRILFALLLGGLSATYLSFNRISHSRLQFQSLQRIRALAKRNAEFLCTLIPSRVVERAFVASNVAHDSLSDSPHERPGGNGSGKENQNPLRELSSWDADAPQLELQEKLDDIVIMFCSLPPLSVLGNDRVAFEMLNDIFSDFDDEVLNFKMFKYHHVFNTYIVASPGAALRHKAYKSRVDEHAAMLALAVRLKQIAASYTAANGDPLWLAIGMDSGDMVGKIVGSEKSFWCLFGPCINLAARLSQRSARDMLYRNSIVVGTQAVADKLQVVRQKIIANNHVDQMDKEGTRQAAESAAQGAASAASAAEASANDAGAASDTGAVSDSTALSSEKGGLMPGFNVVELGVQSIKGHGDLLLFTVCETDPTPRASPEATSGSEGYSTSEGQRLYSNSFKNRARAAIISGSRVNRSADRVKGKFRGSGELLGSGRYSASGGRKSSFKGSWKGSFKKREGEERMQRVQETTDEAGSAEHAMVSPGRPRGAPDMGKRAQY